MERRVDGWILDWINGWMEGPKGIFTNFQDTAATANGSINTQDEMRLPRCTEVLFWTHSPCLFNESHVK